MAAQEAQLMAGAAPVLVPSIASSAGGMAIPSEPEPGRVPSADPGMLSPAGRCFLAETPEPGRVLQADPGAALYADRGTGAAAATAAPDGRRWPKSVDDSREAYDWAGLAVESRGLLRIGVSVRQLRDMHRRHHAPQGPAGVAVLLTGASEVLCGPGIGSPAWQREVEIVRVWSRACVRAGLTPTSPVLAAEERWALARTESREPDVDVESLMFSYDWPYRQMERGLTVVVPPVRGWSVSAEVWEQTRRALGFGCRAVVLDLAAALAGLGRPGLGIDADSGLDTSREIAGEATGEVAA